MTMVSGRRWFPIALSCLLVGALLASAGAVAGSEAARQPTVDNTVTRIELAPDGSARWTVTIRTRLDTDADVEEYGAFQARFRSNTSRFLDPFGDRITAVVANAGAATGREMAAGDFSASTRIQEVPRRWGIVEYAFTWTAFAAVDGDAVVVGDAFAGGFFLAADDRLVIVPPDGYAVAEAAPDPTSQGEGAVEWSGRQDFADGRPLVRAVPGDAGGAGDAVTGLSRPLLVGAAAAVLLLLAGVAAVSYRRRAGVAAPPSTATDEERVLELLASRGGRLPQSEVVETFDWSTSKTSRLLSRMAEEGRIEKLQLGRQNLIRLPDEED